MPVLDRFVPRVRREGCENGYVVTRAISSIEVTPTRAFWRPSSRTVIPKKALDESGFRVGADLEAYEAVGCARCGHSGYRGRIGLFSVMVMSDEIKSLTVQRAPESEISEVARSQGMVTVREDGLQKARAGVTSIEEIARVTT